MANTAIVGNAGVISVNGENVADVRSYSIDITADTIETTTMGGANSGRVYTKGLTSFSGTADVYWNAEHFATSQSQGDGKNDLDALIQGAVGADEVAIVVYPEGSGASWGGDIHITGYSITASFDGLIEASVSFQGTGQLTYTAS